MDEQNVYVLAKDEIYSYLKNVLDKLNSLNRENTDEINTNFKLPLVKNALNHIYKKIEVYYSSFHAYTDLKNLRFIISHLHGIKHYIAFKNGKSLLDENLKTELSELLDQGDELLKKIDKQIMSSTAGLSNEKASVLSRPDDFEKERTCVEEQTFLEKNEIEEFLNQLWIHAIEEGHKSKRIFISYAWPIENEHNEKWTKEFVKQLTKHLITAGFQVYLDENKSGAGYLLSKFMQKIHTVDHVLVISTRTMGEKLKKPDSGVCYEYKQIKACIEAQPQLFNKRFVIPVLLNNQNYCHDDFKNLAEVSFCYSGYFNSLKSLITRIYGFGDQIEAKFQKFYDYIFQQQVASTVQTHCLKYSKEKEFQEDINLYVPIDGTYTAHLTASFDLYNGVKKFIDGNKEVLLLLGESGGGKSLFGQAMVQKLAQEYKPGDPIPFYVSLPSMRAPKERLMEEILLRHGFSAVFFPILKKTHRFFIVLDAYDELNMLENFYRQNNLDQWKVKIIITCRTQYLTQLSNYQSYFLPFRESNARNDLFEELYVAPFSPAQIDSYVKKYLSVERKMTGEWQEVQTYLTWINQIPGLSALVRTPFLLKIAIQVLPEIVAQYKVKRNQQEYFNMTQAKLFDYFINFWFAREEERLVAHMVHPGCSMRKDYMAFCKALAKQMHENNRLKSVIYVEESDIFDNDNTTMSAWEKFFSDKFVSSDRNDEKRRERRILARKGAPLRKVAENQYAFIHTLVLDYFVSLNICPPDLIKMQSQKPSEPEPKSNDSEELNHAMVASLKPPESEEDEELRLAMALSLTTDSTLPSSSSLSSSSTEYTSQHTSALSAPWTNQCERLKEISERSRELFYYQLFSTEKNSVNQVGRDISAYFENRDEKSFACTGKSLYAFFKIKNNASSQLSLPIASVTSKNIKYPQ